jgi:hypothetical protein
MSNALGNNGGRVYSFASQPVLIDCNFVVDASNGNGLGIRQLKGQGVRNVFMHTSATPGKGSGGYLNPNPAPGFALIQLRSNYNRYLGGFSGFVSPTTGGTVAINSTSLTPGNAYIIGSAGVGPAGSATIAPVADSSGSLAGTYFTLYDSYGNSFVIWFYVTGVGGSQPLLGNSVLPGQRGLQYVQQTIAENASAATIGAALVSTINLLPSGVVGTFSFTATGTTTVTVTSTANLPLSGVPQDGSQVVAQSNSQPVPIWFNLSPSGSASANSIWSDSSGHLYTVSATISSGSLLKTMGVQSPFPSSGVLTYVSGSGSTTALNYSSAVAGLATGFTFALVNFNTNLACWQGVGLPLGVTPNVGASFIATASGVSTGGGSTGLVLATGASGIPSIEVVGDPNQSISPNPTGGSAHPGGWILVQLLAPTSSSVTTPTPTAPAANSVCGLSFYVDAKFSPSNVGL